MKKRIFAFLLALCLILNMTSGIAFATEGAEDDGHTWPEKWTVVTKATCTAAGWQVKYCQDPDCGIELASEEIPMLPHTP